MQLFFQEIIKTIADNVGHPRIPPGVTHHHASSIHHPPAATKPSSQPADETPPPSLR